MADNKMTKSIGEHWVCSELARRGWAPALTRDGLSRTDILSVGTHLERRPRIEVQVKSATQYKNPEMTSWPLGNVGTAKGLAQSAREWFIMVSIPRDVNLTPEAFIIPRDHAVAATHIAHTDWLTTPGTTTRERKAKMERARVRCTVFAGYRGRWDLLENLTTACPVLLPNHYSELAEDDRVGLPEGHPWRLETPSWG